MKTTIRQCFGNLSAVILFLTAAHSTQAADKIPVASKATHYSVVVNKTQNSKKPRIRLYASAGTDKVLCSVNGIQGKKYEIFIFNLYSQLVTQMTMRSGETSTLDNVTRGSYIFEVLVDDEHVEHGQLTVK
jgi:hypothetical protein